MSQVHVVVPAGLRDLARPSGGNAYDRRVVEGLEGLGWGVIVHEVAGSWPHPDGRAVDGVARVLAGIPSGATVLVDGLVGCCCAEVLVPESARVRVVVLVHLPLVVQEAASAPDEAAVLTAAAGVVTTSAWTRELVVGAYGLDADDVAVARPGVDPAAPTVPSGDGHRLLCVAAVTPHKGHLDLVEALARVADLTWTLELVGSLEVDPAQVDAVRRRLADRGLTGRVSLSGVRAGTDLERAYAAADLLVLPSHGETYGMVVTEALAHGVPVVATQVGGVAEAMGETAQGRPGLLVPPHHPDDLAVALRAWLEAADLRARLRAAAGERRSALAGWSATAAAVSRALERVRAD